MFSPYTTVWLLMKMYCTKATGRSPMDGWDKQARNLHFLPTVYSPPLPWGMCLLAQNSCEQNGKTYGMENIQKCAGRGNVTGRDLERVDTRKLFLWTRQSGNFVKFKRWFRNAFKGTFTPQFLWITSCYVLRVRNPEIQYMLHYKECTSLNSTLRQLY
jgi:hypothetical protein